MIEDVSLDKPAILAAFQSQCVTPIGVHEDEFHILFRIEFDELDFNFGERWIPTGIYSAYMSYLFHTDVKIAMNGSTPS